jgi:DNA-binding response OmpR family regulator
MAIILALEDDVLSQQLLRLIFEREGHQISLLDQSKQAWQLLEEQPLPDLLILDHHLRDGKGVDFLNAFKSNLLYEMTPVLVCITAPSRDVVVQYTSWNVQKILVKPYIQEKLLSEAKSALGLNPYKEIFEQEEVFCKRAGITKEIYKETMQMGVKAAAADLEELKVAIHDAEGESIRMHISRMQSLGANIGFKALANYCHKILQKTYNSGTPQAYLQQMLIDFQLMFRVFSAYADGKIAFTEEGVKRL